METFLLTVIAFAFGLWFGQRMKAGPVDWRKALLTGVIAGFIAALIAYLIKLFR
jgi:hypothetical protein